MADLAKWNVHGRVASLRTELAEWDLHSGYWKPAGHFTVATFRRDGAISSTDGYNPDGSVAHSRWIYDEFGRLRESHSWMNDDTPHRSLYLYDDAGRHLRTFAVSPDVAETDVETSSYDAEGRRTKVSVFGSRAGNVSYSIEGTNMGLGAPGAVRVVITYDHNDLPVKEVFEDAKQNPLRQVIMRRDNAGRLVKVEIHMGGPSMFSMFGQSDQPISAEADKALSLMMGSLGGIFSETNYAYDTQGRLIERTGRFLSPDPLGGSLANPQTLNKYAYAVNNPLKFVDPTGLYHCVWSESSGGFDEDDTPENGGATQQQCSEQGGESWSPDPGDLSAPSNTANFQIGTGGSNSGQQNGQNGSNGAFDSNSAAAQLFGAQGAPYWVGANQFVTNATIGYTGMYGAVLGAPAAYSGAVSAAARGFGWYYGYTGASGVVLGTFADDYQGVAQSIWANYLNAPTGVYNFFNNADEWWTLNQGFLESSIFRGQQFYLSSEPMGTGGFYMEMLYLQSRGIDPLTLPRALVPR